MKGEDRDVRRGGEGGLQIHLSGVRLGEHGDVMPHIGGGEAGVVHRASDGLDGSSVVVHIGVLGDFADDERMKLAHFSSSFRMALSASTNS